MTRPVRAIILTAAGWIATIGSAHAAAFALRTGSADWTANAFAGDTAKAYDASTVWTNPAGMVRLNRNEIDSTITMLIPRAEFSGVNIGPEGVATTGTGAPGNAIRPAATGGVFGVWSYSPNLKFGMAVNTPFGERASYPYGWTGRFQSLVSAITDLQVALTAAYRINRQFSIGGGPVIDYLHERLTAALPTGPLGAAYGDPVGDLRGEDVAAGFVVSGLFQLSPGTRFGLTYRSRIQHDIKGGQRVYVPPALTAANRVVSGLLLAGSSSAGFKITLPDSVTFGAYHEITPRLAIMADLQWTHWALFDDLTVVPTNPLAPRTTNVQNFRNAWFASIGASYKLTPRLMLQTGLAYDQTPVRDAARRNTRIPDYDRFELGVGATYALFKTVNLQAGFLHEFAGNVSIRNAASPSSGTVVGRYHDSADTVSLGMTMTF